MFTQRLLCAPFIAALIMSLSVLAWGQAAPAYNNLRFEEDWSGFDKAASDDLFAPIKKVDISDNVWVSFGGELRIRGEFWDNFGFTDDTGDDEFAYGRAFVHADLHVGTHFRLFVQGRWSDLTQRDLAGGKRDALDLDRGDLWNTFAEVRFDTAGPTVIARVGRQELQLGAQRLVSPLDWSNNRRIFDGAVVKLIGNEGRWKLDLFSVAPVVIDGDSFTWNDTDHTRLFSGAYYTRKLTDSGHNMDAYFFALNTLKNLPIEEDRYTVGARFFGPIAGNFTYEVEGAYQFGERTLAGTYFDRNLDISAWMFTAEAKYTFKEVKSTPFILLGFDYASGDSNPSDTDFGTFNQLFPLGHAYLGYIDAIGRQNVMDARLSIGAFPLDKRMKVQADWHWLWRADEEDGLYNAGGGLSRGAYITTPGGRVVRVDDRELGQELDLTMSYKFNPHWNWLMGFSRFWAGDFIEDSGTSADTNFLYSQVQLTF